jgi:hypothetical protein
MQAESTALSVDILPPDGAIVLPGGLIQLPGHLREFLADEASTHGACALEYPKCSADVIEALPRITLALAMWEASESGILDATALDHEVRLADIEADIADTRREFAEELDESRAAAQDFIAGNAPEKRFSDDRAETIGEYRRIRLRLKHDIACCDEILTVIHEARTVGGEDG